ncbi:MAG: hypothetical protein ACO1O1_08590 [Adhaeribacter sp.]
MLVGSLVFCAFRNEGKISYFRPRTLALKPETTRPFYVAFKDSTFNDTLYQTLSKEGYPLSYYRNIQASVCFDDKCRLLDIILYWNITGRYLGFELPEKEFLSKSDHEPFRPGEYERLHQILADPQSPIAGFSYEQLTPRPANTLAGLDAVSTPTPPAVADHVVAGAAYTTYRLWHFVYGPTRQEVMKLTARELSPSLMQLILASPVETDKMWGLNHLKGYVALTPPLRAAVLGFIQQDNYSLAERAVNALDNKELADPALQLALLDKFYSTGYSIKKLLIDKLKEAPALDRQAASRLAKNLADLNGEILSRVLDTFRRHQVGDRATLLKVADLLQHDNAFISNKAYDFLRQTPVPDQQIKDKIRKYQDARP